jgi:hypothetical protein
MGGFEEQLTISQVTQTFISHIVLELLKPLYPNDFERIKSFDFNGLINFFKNAIPHLELPDLDPDNPFQSALALAKQHFDDPHEEDYVKRLGPDFHNVFDILPALKAFFETHGLGNHPEEDLIHCLQEIGFPYLKHIQGVNVNVVYR